MTRKPRKRPKTLSEKLSELDLAQGKLFSADKVTEKILHAAIAQFCLAWGDDGYDPIRSEVVGLFRIREDYEIAQRKSLIPKGQNLRAGEAQMVKRLEIPLVHSDKKIISSTAHVVFYEKHEGYGDYGRHDPLDHRHYLTDCSGYPVRAFACRDKANRYAHDLADELLEKPGEISWNFFRSDMDWELLSSLSRYEFVMALEPLGINIGPEDWESDESAAHLALQLALGVDLRDQFAKIAVSQASKRKAKSVLALLDRFHFYKTVGVPIIHLG